MSTTGWAQYCRMTCLGGSESGTCSCRTPKDCELQNHPDYDAERAKARTRMTRLFLSKLNEQT